jgi:hypothetical protein
MEFITTPEGTLNIMVNGGSLGRLVKDSSEWYYSADNAVANARLYEADMMEISIKISDLNLTREVVDTDSELMSVYNTTDDPFHKPTYGDT